MKDSGRTSPKGCNNPNMPKAGPKAPGPKDTSNGVSLTQGYASVSPSGDSPRAVTPND